MRSPPRAWTGWPPSERALLQDASVLGRSFTAAGAAALRSGAGRGRPRLLDGLVAKQILGRDDDPRSPERGQYDFLQALLRTSPTARCRAGSARRHLAAARHLQEAWPGEAPDIAEVLAAHYLEAIARRARGRGRRRDPRAPRARR